MGRARPRGVDPFGYLWAFSQPIADVEPEDGLEAVRTSWFGTA